MNTHAKALIICFNLLFLTSCTTQKALNETKRQFDNGDYGWAVYTGTVGVTMAALVDVFTLGGTTDTQTGYNTISGIANNNTNVAPSVSSAAYSQQATSTRSSGSSSVTPSGGSTNAMEQPSSASQQKNGALTKPYPDASHCLKRDNTSNSIVDFWINSCSFPVTVMWYDANECKTGCMDGVGANTRESVTKGKPGSSYNWAGCPKPSTPRGPDGVHQWKNEGRHQCAF